MMNFSRNEGRVVACATIGGLVVLVALGLLQASREGVSSAVLTATESGVELRVQPLRIEPAHRELMTLSYAESAAVRDAIRSLWARRETRHARVLHLVRLAPFVDESWDPPWDSVHALREPLLSEQAAIREFGHRGIIVTRSGVRFPTRNALGTAEEIATESHRDQTLATLLETGLPTSTALETSAGQFTLQDVAADSVGNFSFGQDELAWTAISYALLLNSKAWTNRFGESFDFNRLTRELLRQGTANASCAGTHQLYALAILERANAVSELLSAEVANQLRDSLLETVHRAETSQNPDGSWSIDWGMPQDAGAEPGLRSQRSSERVLMTGHLCEWALILPEDCRLDDAVLRRAVRWLVARIQSADSAEICEQFCAYSHAIRVILLTTAPANSKALP